ncbi:MAG: VanW family protein [Chloroflexi bacterium]|nr:VanW family protein [Chloroflexota bacterium]
MRVLRALAFGLTAIVVLAASCLAAFELSTQDRIKPGVSVLDVPVGGLTVQEAQEKLAPRALAILDQPVQIQLDTNTWTTTPRQLGVALDPQALAQQAYAVGREGPPLQSLEQQVSALRYGDQISVVGQADGAMLDALVKRIAQQVDTSPRAADLSINDDASLAFTTSQPGLQLDQQASRSAIAQALTNGDAQVSLTAHPLQPATLTGQVQAAHDQLQQILNPQPVTITAAEYQRTLQTSDVLKLVELNPPANGQPATVSVNTDALQPILDDATHAVDQPPTNARFTWDGANLSVLRPSQPGRGLDQSAARDVLSSQILAGAKTISLPVNAVPPAVSSDDGGASLGIHELIEQSTTAFVGSVPEKAYNIQLAAKRLNGVVVPPGGTFSFNDEVGPTTLEAGFKWGFGLTTGANGGAHTVPSVAGGICQVATTLFQPVFWAGYQLEERYWHLYWIPSYTSRDIVGLDATVDEDAGLDFKWINPTNDYVLIQSSTTADHITFSLYGRKPAWNVQVDPPEISNRVSPDTTPDVEAEPQLPWGRIVPVETARDGFQVVITRHVQNQDGSPSRDLVLKSIYQPGHNVTLVGSAGAPDATSLTGAIDRVRASMEPQAAPAAPATAAPPATTYDTANGARTLSQIRDELRGAGWGGGSDQDAVATYKRLADAAHGH